MAGETLREATGGGLTAPTRRECFASVAPGLEHIAATELSQLAVSDIKVTEGGVTFTADDRALLRCNLRLRSVSRVIVRVAEFRATAFSELERLAKSVMWEEFVAAGDAVRLRVTCKKSILYHSDAVAERVMGAITARVKGVRAASNADEDESDESETGPAQLFVVRFLRDVCTISADSSGELLHRRGYRLATAKAPMRETLAASMLLALGYDGSVPLVDAMCGAGTIPIEGALIARHMAPGLGRTFRCEYWPEAGKRPGAAAVREKAAALAIPLAPQPILASDRDRGAAEATLANAERAGVEGDLRIFQRALSSIEVPEGPGLLLVNPPYGGRVGDSEDLRNLYAQLGNIARERCRGWTIGVLSADRALERQVGLEFREVLTFRNGGIPVRLIAALVP
ncbi:MAG: class I SAM-dependent RNA methyltransferase [Betaproteobacteria bacterium]|nr:class I SAM-dependent RNA methyltransferase [Betaproteobacteria bacterium]